LITIININVYVMQEQNVKVCKGPNCKAWCSDRVARELSEASDAFDLNDVKVCRIPCMDACHGGVSVRIGSRRKVLKVKDAEDVLTELGLIKAVAC
jgi:hypothetical protein